MSDGYGSHDEYMEWVREAAEKRAALLAAKLRDVFAPFIEIREVEVIVFSGMKAADLANAIQSQPVILKPLLAACNLAGRAVERDLGIKNLDTYRPRVSGEEAHAIAGFLIRFLPPYLELPAIGLLDRMYFIDKEIRKVKGQWEKAVIQALNKTCGDPNNQFFRKRKFLTNGEEFEIDAACLDAAGDIAVGVDVKRIEARRDIHKRCDEIVNKARKLKTAIPTVKFGAVIYYPYIDEHVNIQSRLGSEVDGVVFASGATESVENAVRLLLATMRFKQ